MFAGTKISLLGMKQGRTNERQYHLFRNAIITPLGSGYILEHADGISRYSTALPRWNFEGKRNIGARYGRGYFSSDRFSCDNICHYTYDHIGRGILAVHDEISHESEVFITRSNRPYNQYIRKSVIPFSSQLAREESYYFDELILSRDSFKHLSHPAHFCDHTIMSTIRAKIPAGRPSSVGKLYISRKDATARPLLNEGELEDALKRLGFEVVVLSELSPEKQIDIFSGADIIVAPHGAGLTSLFCCRAGTRVVEIFDPNVGTAAFCAISKYYKLQYAALFGTSQENGWLIDVSKVTAAVE